LPKDWAESVRHAVLNIVGVVRLAMLSGRELLIQEGDVPQAQIHQLEEPRDPLQAIQGTVP